MKYKYQMHTHTSPTSKCARMNPRELAKALYDAGYSGCVLTNHFYHGNTGISRELPWKDFVEPYERDYLSCKAEAEKYGIDVIFGIEEGIGNHNEVLSYGLTPSMLYEHPELRDCDAETFRSLMRELGVLVIQSHPCRYPCTPMPIELIDGAEVYNHSHNPEYNQSAQKYVEEHPGLILTSGADAHNADSIGLAGIAADRKIHDAKELCEILKSGEYELLKP